MSELGWWFEEPTSAIQTAGSDVWSRLRVDTKWTRGSSIFLMDSWPALSHTILSYIPRTSSQPENPILFLLCMLQETPYLTLNTVFFLYHHHNNALKTYKLRPFFVTKHCSSLSSSCQPGNPFVLIVHATGDPVSNSEHCLLSCASQHGRLTNYIVSLCHKSL